jgi:CRP/FNR family cyclic AMP-dependent transcriptional regulator
MDSRMLEGIPLFQSLSETERAALSGRFVVRRHPRNAVVINEGDETSSLYVIVEGRVKVYLTDEHGKEIVLNTQGPGEYFGEVSLLDDHPRSASVATLEDSKFAVLMKQAFIDCLRENPDIALQIIRGLTERLRGLSENVRNLALMDVYGRVARLLLDAAVTCDGVRVIDEQFTYADIAARVGASPKMVGRIMQELKKGGYLRKAGGKLVIEKSFPSSW